MTDCICVVLFCSALSSRTGDGGIKSHDPAPSPGIRTQEIISLESDITKAHTYPATERNHKETPLLSHNT